MKPNAVRRIFQNVNTMEDQFQSESRNGQKSSAPSTASYVQQACPELTQAEQYICDHATD